MRPSILGVGAAFSNLEAFHTAKLHALGPQRLRESREALQHILAFVVLAGFRPGPLKARIGTRAIFPGIDVEEACGGNDAVGDFGPVREKSGVGVWAWRRVHALRVGQLVDLGLRSRLAALGHVIDLESTNDVFARRSSGDGAVDQKGERHDDLRTGLEQRRYCRWILRRPTCQTVAICIVRCLVIKASYGLGLFALK